MIIKDLVEINRRLSYDLWNLSFFSGKTSGLSPRLIFPKERKKNIKRISEQEARILYCNILNNLNYFYSIETPTENTFKRTAHRPLSALFDLTLYTYDSKFNRKVNVEFKAKSVGPESIRKDIEKIIIEKKIGNWVHILKNIDRATLSLLFDKFIGPISKYFMQINNVSILFCFCILEKEFSLVKHLNYNVSSKENIVNILEDFFSLSKKNNLNNISNKKVGDQKDILSKNNWLIIEK